MAERDLSSDVQALKKDLAELRDDIAAMGGTMVSEGKKRASKMRASVEDSVESSVETVRDTIEERPFTSLLVAFGAGLVFGKFLDRK